MTDNEQLIWAAGFLSGMGGFQIIQNNNTHTIRYQGSTYLHREAMMRLADAMNVNVGEVPVKGKGDTEKTAYKIACSGKPLHKFMTKVWDYLTPERKREYSKLYRELKTGEKR